MRKSLLILSVILATVSISGCMVSSKLAVTNSTSLSQGNFRVVDHLNQTATSTHFLGVGGWTVRNAKENIIRNWEGRLGPQQVLSDVVFTESTSHFIPFLFFKERVAISANVVEFTDGKGGAAAVRPPYAPSDESGSMRPEEATKQGKLTHFNIPSKSKEISVSNKRIQYDPNVPIDKQIIEGIDAVKKDYNSYSFKTNVLKSRAKKNLEILREWYSISGLKSAEIDNAFDELEKTMNVKKKK